MSAALRQQGGSVEGLIQRGVLPSDPRLANERSNCKRQSGRQESQQIGSQRPVYAVSGVTLGAIVQFGSSAYREYECSPSDQFDGFTWCQKTRKEKERRGTFSATYSILHSRDGATVYVNRYQKPAFFGAKEADSDIQQYSRKIGESPRITRMPHRAGFPTGILASWGKVELEPLDDDSIKALADGRRPTTKGYFIDFIGDFHRSAREGLPIYGLGGGPGFVWVASFDQKGRGTLRLTAVDASALAPTTPPKLPIETAEKTKAPDAIANMTNQLSREEAESEPADKARIDAQRVREDAEKARDEAARAKADIEKAVAGERAKVDAIIAQLQAEKSAAKAKARTMEFVAYGAIIGLILLVVIIASVSAVRGQKTTTPVEQRSEKRETRELELTELAALTKDRIPINWEHLSVGPLAVVTETEVASSGGSKTTTQAEHLSVGRQTREFECTELVVVTETESAKTGDSQRSESNDANSSQATRVSASLRASAPNVIVGIVIAGMLSAAAAVGTAVLYSKTQNPYEHEQASVGRTGMADGVKASVIGWQENEHGAAAEIIGECVNRSINFKAMVLGRDGEPTVELRWDDTLEDLRNETGKFMQVIYLPITVKINDDEPQIVKRLHEEPYRNVIRLVTLLLEGTPASDPQQAVTETKTVSVQLDNLLSPAEKAALTSYYPDKRLKILEAKRIMVQFDTSKGTMLIKIMMDDPAIRKLVELCQSQ
jgi:hypothetical protein